MLTVFRNRLSNEGIRQVVDAFEGQTAVSAGDDVASGEYPPLLERIPAIAGPVAELAGGDPTPAQVASAVEFVLEGLHLSKRLNKDAVGSRSNYRSRV